MSFCISFLILFATSLFGDLLAQRTAVMGGDTCRSPLFYWDEDEDDDEVDGDGDKDGNVSSGWKICLNFKMFKCSNVSMFKCSDVNKVKL